VTRPPYRRTGLRALNPPWDSIEYALPGEYPTAIRELIEAVKGIEGLLPVAQALSASEEVRVARFDAALANVEDAS